MKKTFFVSLLFIAVAAQAQRENSRFLIKAGVTIPKHTVSGTTNDSRKTYLGYTAGIAYFSPPAFDEPVGLLLELDYVQGGSVNSSPGIPGTKEIKDRINYVQGGMGLHLSPTDAITIAAGGFFAKSINGTSKITPTTGAGTSTSLKLGGGSGNDYRGGDLGFRGSISFHIKKVSLGIAFQQSLIDIDPDDNITQKNQIYSFTFGLAMGKKKK